MIGLYVKFNNHEILLRYSLWKGHGEMKISPWKKKLPISSEWKDAHVSNIPRSKRTLIHTITRYYTHCVCVHKLFKVFQLYTCLKCTQSTWKWSTGFCLIFFGAGLWLLARIVVHQLWSFAFSRQHEMRAGACADAGMAQLVYCIHHKMNFL